MKRKIEILAPAGSMEGLQAAIAGGCDAVYIGGTKYGARAYANNLDTEEMIRAIEYAHLHDVKIYLTINTLVKGQELEELYDYLLPYYVHGIDAVIVQDFGVLEYVSKAFPGLEIHASTQMTLTMADGANVLKKHNVTRLVTSRELGIEEIKEIRKNTDLEIETFVHGALCYSFSGQCLMSSMIGGRSGNRGRCAQPCRKNYRLNQIGDKKINEQPAFILSPKDICTIYDIPDLVDSGIDSFKIEGRMKRPEYAAMTAFLYRKYVDMYQTMGRKEYERYMDKYPEELEGDVKNLMDLYNRGSFSEGYFYEYNGKKLMSMARPNHSGVLVGEVTAVKGNRAQISLCENIFAQDVLEIRGTKEECIYDYTVKDDVNKKEPYGTNFKKGCPVVKGLKVYRTKNQSLLTHIQEDIILKEDRKPVHGFFQGRIGEQVSFSLSYKDLFVTEYGAVAEKAKNQPIAREKIQKQLEKAKDTPFVLETLDIDSSDDWFMPVGQLNELRRNTFEALERAIAESYMRKEPNKLPVSKVEKEVDSKKSIGISATVMSEEQLDTVLGNYDVNQINIHFSLIENMNLEDWKDKVIQSEQKIYVVLPTIFRKKTMKEYNQAVHPVRKAMDYGMIDGFVVKNLEEFSFVKEFGKEIMLDYNMYIMNDEGKIFWKELGVEHFTASCELNYQELKSLGIENFDMIVYGYLPVMTAQQCVVKNVTYCTHQSEYYEFTDQNQNVFYGRNFCSCCYNVIYNGKPLHLLEHLSEIKGLNVRQIRLDFTMESKQEVQDIVNLYACALAGKNQPKDVVGDFTKGHFKRGIE